MVVIVVVFTRSHQTSPAEKTIDHLWPSTDSIRKPLKSSATVFFLEKFVLFGAAGPDAFWLPRLAVVSFGQECFVLFSIPYYIESSQIAAVEYLRLSACISRGWHQLFIHEEKGRVEKETRNDKTPWSRFSTVSSTFFSSSHRFVCVGFCSRRFWNTRGFGPTSLVVATVSRHDSVRLNIFFFSFLFLPFLYECGVCVVVHHRLSFFICHCLYATLFVVYIIIIISCRW